MWVLASIVPYESFPTTDGNILLGGGNDKLYAILCQRIGRPEWITDPRFVTNEERVRNRKILVPMMAEITRSKTTQVTSPPLTSSHCAVSPPHLCPQLPAIRYSLLFFSLFFLKYGCVRVFFCYHRNGWRYSTPAESRTPPSTIYKPRYPTPTFLLET